MKTVELHGLEIYRLCSCAVSISWLVDSLPCFESLSLQLQVCFSFSFHSPAVYLDIIKVFTPTDAQGF